MLKILTKSKTLSTPYPLRQVAPILRLGEEEMLTAIMPTVCSYYKKNAFVDESENISIYFNSFYSAPSLPYRSVLSFCFHFGLFSLSFQFNSILFYSILFYLITFYSIPLHTFSFHSTLSHFTPSHSISKHMI